MITTPITAAYVRGGAELEPVDRGLRLHRLPAWVRDQFPDGQLLAMESQPSGARLVFRTDATTVELVSHPTRVAYRGADRARGCFDVYVDGDLASRDVLDGGDAMVVDLTTGATAYEPGPPHPTTVPLPEGTHHRRGLAAAQRGIRPRRAPQRRATRGGCRFGPAMAAPRQLDQPRFQRRRTERDLARGRRAAQWRRAAQPRPRRQRARRPVPGPRHPRHRCRRHQRQAGHQRREPRRQRLRAFVPAVHGFLDTIRDGHPDTPLLLVSPIFCGIHESVPGPGTIDPATLGTDQVQFMVTGDPAEVAQGKLTLEVIRHELRSLFERRSADPHLHHLEGTELYGPADAVELALPDALHPGPEAHRLMGERFARLAFGEGGAFGRSRQW